MNVVIKLHPVYCLPPDDLFNIDMAGSS